MRGFKKHCRKLGILARAYNNPSSSELREGYDKFGVTLGYKLCVTCLKNKGTKHYQSNERCCWIPQRGLS